MSVRVETYLIRGVKLNYEQFSKLWNKWDDDNSLDEREVNFPYRGKDVIGKCGVLQDCYSSDYCYAGRCIAYQDDYEFTQSFGDIEIPDYYDRDQEITDWLLEKELIDLVEDLKPRYYLITHYT